MITIKSISNLHDFYGCERPRHPLISVIDLTKANRPKEAVMARTDFYTIFCKQFKGTLHYGRSYYDFSEGTLMFTAPHQVVSASPDMKIEEGWGLFFHPDLLNRSHLGSKIQQYSYFHYDVHEALHISDDEKRIITDCIEKIQREYSQNIDKHTEGLILTNLELLLDYCDRFYDRQFLTRSKATRDIVQRFEKSLKDYFQQDITVKGLPDVKYFAAALHLSPNYLSDLLKKYTGKTTIEHIHLELVDKAKSLLWGTEKTVSEVAYELGFGHPSHFTKIFKARTGQSPSEYRQSG